MAVVEHSENLSTDVELHALTAAACSHGFSDPSRLATVRHLALGEHRVVELTEHLGLAQSTLSKHLGCVTDRGRTRSRPAGRASLWSLNHPEAAMAPLTAAETLLGMAGDDRVLCPSHGRHDRDHLDPERDM